MVLPKKLFSIQRHSPYQSVALEKVNRESMVLICIDRCKGVEPRWRASRSESERSRRWTGCDSLPWYLICLKTDTHCFSEVMAKQWLSEPISVDSARFHRCIRERSTPRSLPACVLLRNDGLAVACRLKDQGRCQIPASWIYFFLHISSGS